MFIWCGLARADFARHSDGEGDRKTGSARETWGCTGSGSDADVIKGMLPLTATECVSTLLLAARGDTADRLRSNTAGGPDVCSVAVSLECSESAGVECDGTGGETENTGALRDAASVFVDSCPTGFNTEGELVTTGGLHCSDTHCTCPGGLVCNPVGDGDPELNFSKPRPRLWPTAAATATPHNTTTIFSNLTAVFRVKLG